MFQEKLARILEIFLGLASVALINCPVLIHHVQLIKIDMSIRPPSRPSVHLLRIVVPRPNVTSTRVRRSSPSSVSCKVSEHAVSSWCIISRTAMRCCRNSSVTTKRRSRMKRRTKPATGRWKFLGLEFYRFITIYYYTLTSSLILIV